MIHNNNQAHQQTQHEIQGQGGEVKKQHSDLEKAIIWKEINSKMNIMKERVKSNRWQGLTLHAS